jgi:hypothetical protein
MNFVHYVTKELPTVHEAALFAHRQRALDFDATTRFDFGLLASSCRRPS